MNAHRPQRRAWEDPSATETARSEGRSEVTGEVVPMGTLCLDYFSQTRMICGGVTGVMSDRQAAGLRAQMARAALPLILIVKKPVARGGLVAHGTNHR